MNDWSECWIDGRTWYGFTLPDGMFRVVPAICGGKGETKTTTVTQTSVPDRSAEEIALMKRQVEVADIQVAELKRQNTALEAIFPEQQSLLRAQTELARSATATQKRELAQAERLAPLQEQVLTEALTQLQKEVVPSREVQEIERLSNERTLALLRGEAPPLLPGQAENIEKVYARAGERGREELTRFAGQLAASRGLRVTDQPIGAEVLREATEFESNLAAARAKSELDVGATNQQFEETVRQFQANLRQRAQENRLMLLGRTGGGPSATGMIQPFTANASQVQSTISPLVDSLARQRLAGATQTSTTRGGGVDLWPSIIQGVATVGAAAVRSTAAVKKAITPYDRDEYDRALAKVNETPVTRWRYRWEPDTGRLHTGPILELSPDDIKADDQHLDVLSYAGLLHAAVKAVDRKVERFGVMLAARIKEAA